MFRFSETKTEVPIPERRRGKKTGPKKNSLFGRVSALGPGQMIEISVSAKSGFNSVHAAINKARKNLGRNIVGRKLDDRRIGVWRIS